MNDSDESQYGPGTYLDDSDGLDQVPDVSHWSSSLPRAYMDTRSGDPGYLKSFTIGSADGDAIQSGIWYNSYIRTVNGDADDDNGFLQAQLGYRQPSWCYTTWCVFGSEHVNIAGQQQPLRFRPGKGRHEGAEVFRNGHNGVKTVQGAPGHADADIVQPALDRGVAHAAVGGKERPPRHREAHKNTHVSVFHTGCAFI